MPPLRLLAALINRPAVGGGGGITLVGSPVAGADAANGTITLNLPSLAQNDVVLVFVACSNSGVLPTMNTAGYTSLSSITNGASVGMQCWWKRMGASPDTTAVVNASGNAGVGNSAVAMCWRGVHTSTLTDATTTTATGTFTAPDSPSITTATDGATVIAAATTAEYDTTITGPSGYSNTTSASANATQSSIVGVASKLIASHAAENPGAFSNWGSGTASWASMTVALKPA